MENKSLQEGKIPKKRKFELDVCEWQCLLPNMVNILPTREDS